MIEPSHRARRTPYSEAASARLSRVSCPTGPTLVLFRTLGVNERVLSRVDGLVVCSTAGRLTLREREIVHRSHLFSLRLGVRVGVQVAIFRVQGRASA